MYDDQDIPDSMKKFFEEMRKEFDVDDFPMMGLQTASMKKFLELQMHIMQRYQALLDDRVSKDPMGDIMSQMTKNFMSTYLDCVKFAREYRKKVLEFQCDMMHKNLSIFEEFLNRFNDKRM